MKNSSLPYIANKFIHKSRSNDSANDCRNVEMHESPFAKSKKSHSTQLTPLYQINGVPELAKWPNKNAKNDLRNGNISANISRNYDKLPWVDNS